MHYDRKLFIFIVGAIFIDESVPKSLADVEKELSSAHGGTVLKGGCWAPTKCAPKHKVDTQLPLIFFLLHKEFLLKFTKRISIKLCAKTPVEIPHPCLGGPILVTDPLYLTIIFSNPF